MSSRARKFLFFAAAVCVAASWTVSCATAPAAVPQATSTPPSPTPAPAPPSPSSSPAEPARFTLRVGESGSLPGDPAKIVFEGVRLDSRCAVDVQCVTAGEAQVTFRLDRPGSMSISFDLGTSRTSSATVNGYTVSLLSVYPAPRSTVRLAPGDYSVEITVSR